MSKIMTIQEAISKLKDSNSIMVGGFLGCGCPELLVDEVIKQGFKNLVLISNDPGFPGKGVGKLQDENRLAKIYASYIGSHPGIGNKMHSGELEVVLVPQGTLAEKIRSAGFGLGGFLTPIGVGTVAEEGKQVIEIKGRKFLLEIPLKADVALIKAWKADKKGNLIYRKATRNFNTAMATAANLVIAQVDEIVEPGELDPDTVHTPGIFVDILVEGWKI